MKTRYFSLVMFLVVLMMIGTSSYLNSLNITLSSDEFMLSLLNVFLCFITSYTSHIINDICQIQIQLDYHMILSMIQYLKNTIVNNIILTIQNVSFCQDLDMLELRKKLNIAQRRKKLIKINEKN